MARQINLFTDVISLLRDIPDLATGKQKPKLRPKNPYNRTLRAKAGDFILQFPLVASDSISFDTVELMRNQLELERAFEFEYILTNTPVQIYDPKDPNSFMSDLHNNINFNESSDSTMKEVNSSLLESLSEKVNIKSLNDLTLTREEFKSLNEGFITFTPGEEAETDYKSITVEYELDEFKKWHRQNPNNFALVIHVDFYTEQNESKVSYSFSGNKLKDMGELRNILLSNGMKDDKGNVFNSGSVELYDLVVREMNAEISNSAKEEQEMNSAVTTVEVNKLNSSLPTKITTEVSFLIRDDSGELINGMGVKKSVKFGVKTVVHPVKSSNVIFYLADNAKRSNLISQFVKFTTGELRLVSDLLLDKERVTKIARDSKKGREGNIWNKLNTIYSVDRIGSYANSRNKNYIPTTALLVSSEEVEEMRRKTGVNLLTDRRAASKIYKEFFLLEFIIVDENREIIYKFLPEHNKFEVVKMDRLGAHKVSNKEKDLSGELLKKLLK